MAVTRDARKQARKPFHLIQGLRGVAALFVVAHHASIMAVERLSSPRAAWPNGAAGVDIFFVISGFVMALSSKGLATAARPGIEFLKRRVERIVPLYWIMTTLKLLLLIAVPASALHGIGSPRHVMASYLFLPSRGPDGSAFPVLVVGWTLNLEMMFYVIFAVALGLRLRPLWLLVPVLGCLALLPFVVGQNVHPMLQFANPIVLEFLYGIALYRLYQHGFRPPAWTAAIAGCIGCIALALIPAGDASLFRPVLWGLPALLIVGAAMVLEERFGRLLRWWMLEAGDASYSIYLVHTFTLPTAGILLARMHVHPAWSMTFAVILGTVMSLVAGEAVYRGLELPMIRYFRHGRRVAVPTGT